MALFRTLSAALQGIDAHTIEVEVDMYPAGNVRDFVTVGMPDAAVRESRERIKSALLNSGFGYPAKSVTINLAPANIRKEGAGFDLPMALAILGAMGIVKRADDHMFVGELSLDGSLRPVRGTLSTAVCASRTGMKKLVVPADNAPEAAVAEGLEVYGLRHLAEVVRFLNNPEAFEPAKATIPEHVMAATDAPDFCEVRGQTMAKRALEVAASGNHNVLPLWTVSGSLGIGKMPLSVTRPSQTTTSSNSARSSFWRAASSKAGKLRARAVQ